ncbi:MAG: MFS transporter [Acidobacteriota bacterium]|nr:MFS transporter [Acidobacteriota bacterium]
MNAAVVGGQAKACPTVSERARRRITRRLIPFLFVLYIVAFLDRVNTGYAGLQMTKDLHFSNEVFGFGSGIFFIGYVLLEIPGTLLVEMWSARKWIARIMISWGFVAALTGLVNTAPQFYWARFLLGVAEAGFFPGVIVYLSHWYRKEDRSKAIAMFMSAIPLSQLVGSPISAALMNIHWLGYAGWRWLLILEGLPAVILGIVTLFYLTDRPQEARWLPDDERDWITGELEREHRAKLAVKEYSIWQAFKNRNVLLLTVVYFFASNVNYGFTLWLPKMVEQWSGLNPLKTTLISAIPFLVAWPAMLLVGWSSDRYRERRWHNASMLFLTAGGLALTRFNGGLGLTIVAFSLAAIGLNARLGPFWAIPGEFLYGPSAAATIGAINCFGNTGGFVGPYIVGWLSNRTGTYASAVLFLIGSAVVSGGLILFVQKTQAGRGS